MREKVSEMPFLAPGVGLISPRATIPIDKSKGAGFLFIFLKHSAGPGTQKIEQRLLLCFPGLALVNTSGDW